jgi:hypothetical protein
VSATERQQFLEAFVAAARTGDLGPFKQLPAADGVTVAVAA